MKYIIVIVCVVGFAATSIAANLNDLPYFHNSKQKGDIDLRVDNINNHTVYSILKGGAVAISVRLDDDFGQNLTIENISQGIALNGIGARVEITEIENSPDFTLFHVARNVTTGSTVTDCVNLESSRLSWFGGPQQTRQYWPVEKLTLEKYSYVSKAADNCGVTERYWLNSAGAFVYVNENSPLFINQNIGRNTLCFVGENVLPYNSREPTFTFNYYIGVAGDARLAHLEAVKKFLKKPTGIPDERMVQHPIWSTWARYKRDINESIVLTLADEIVTNGFNNSQYEIDDDWEVCYGALKFNERKFPNIKNLVDTLKSKGFRVTLWIHPFINKGCEPYYSEAKSKGYFVIDHNNSTDTQWWNSGENEAAYIDFTKPAAAAWFTERLNAIKRDTGIDSFKFDAGETSWSPQDPVLNSSIGHHPNAITVDYLRTVGQFGPLVEVRSGQGTQDLPIFLRIIDKDSVWTWSNGLPTLITTLLQLNMVGYGFVLPDMIGGNGYNGRPSKELFIRWLQANVFMPSLQFSYVPWDYDSETIAICLSFTKLHAEYANVIVERFKLLANEGQPVNPPIWWTDPTDRVAQQISDEFLLGDSILAAPIIELGATSRHIYLPQGTWTDGNTKKVHTGPKWIMEYPAPLNILPYFIRRK